MGYPHPSLVSNIIQSCLAAEIHVACIHLKNLYNLGYSFMDIIVILYKAVRRYEPLEEYLKLELLKEIGFTHIRFEEGIQSTTQLTGLLARLCKYMLKSRAFS